MLRDLFAIFPLICCATGPGKGRRFAGLADMKPGHGLLYIYRTHHDVGCSAWHDVFLNKTKVAGLVDGSHPGLCGAGRYSIRTRKSLSVSALDPGPGEIAVEPDTVTFPLYGPKYEQYWGLASTLNPMAPVVPMPEYKSIDERWTVVEKERALPEIRECIGLSIHMWKRCCLSDHTIVAFFLVAAWHRRLASRGPNHGSQVQVSSGPCLRLACSERQGAGEQRHRGASPIDVDPDRAFPMNIRAAIPVPALRVGLPGRSTGFCRSGCLASAEAAR